VAGECHVKESNTSCSATIAIASTKTFCRVTLVMSFFKLISLLLCLEIDTKSESHSPTNKDTDPYAIPT